MTEIHKKSRKLTSDKTIRLADLLSDETAYSQLKTILLMPQGRDGRTPMDTEYMIERFQHLQYFRETKLTHENLEQVCQGMQYARFTPAQYIVPFGTSGTHFSVILKG